MAPNPKGLGLLGAGEWQPSGMVTVHVELPDAAFSASHKSPAEMAGELRLAAVVYLYSRELVSQELGSRIAGLDRVDFIVALARAGVHAFTVDMGLLRRELADG